MPLAPPWTLTEHEWLDHIWIDMSRRRQHSLISHLETLLVHLLKSGSISQLGASGGIPGRTAAARRGQQPRRSSHAPPAYAPSSQSSWRWPIRVPAVRRSGKPACPSPPFRSAARGRLCRSLRTTAGRRHSPAQLLLLVHRQRT